MAEEVAFQVGRQTFSQIIRLMYGKMWNVEERQKTGKESTSSAICKLPLNR